MKPSNSIPYLEYRRRIYAELLKAAKGKREQREEDERQLSPNKPLENRNEYTPPPATHGDLDRVVLWSFMIFLVLSDAAQWGALPGVSAKASREDVSKLQIQELGTQVMFSHAMYCQTKGSQWEYLRRRAMEQYHEVAGKHFHSRLKCETEVRIRK